MTIQPTIQKDFYKAGHPNMFPENTTFMFNNFTPRSSRIKDINKVVVFNVQYLIIEYFIKQWNENFFNKSKEEVISKYKRIMDNCLGKDSVPTIHLENLHDLGYLPLEIRSLDEGSLCPIGVPLLTYYPTHEHGYFVPGMLETILSTTLWQGITSATIALEYKKLLSEYAIKTVGNDDFVKFQGHDFSMRGMSSLETACISGAGHLLSFVGTDTIPSIEFLETYYGANVEKELVGVSVPASEHSVECMHGEGNEKESILRSLKLYPTGIVSKVMDTWDITKVVKPNSDGILTQCKTEIMNREGTLVIRPDSTPDGVTIADLLCGKGNDAVLSSRELEAYYPDFYKKGLLQCLYETFGGFKNKQGYIELDSHIKIIYGDGLGLHNLKNILERIQNLGFATTNVVMGFGSYGYQMNSRDVFGFAVKATYGEVNNIGREIYKDPITDSGIKKSAKGLTVVYKNENGDYYLKDQATLEEVQSDKNELKIRFRNGNFYNQTTLTEIRNRVNI